MAKRIEKSELPTKICPVCNRSFRWRKSWSKNWRNVIYCSDQCRARKKSAPLPNEYRTDEL
ncbi:MAG: DUF2256 domain-containing protein [Planctomycetota bacterium]